MNNLAQHQGLDAGALFVDEKPRASRFRRFLHGVLTLSNLSLLVLFPIAWGAPIMRAGLLPFFKLDEITVITGLKELWSQEIFLALLVTVFALVAPYLKTLGLALVHFNLLSDRLLPALAILGKLAMADIFLLSIYIISAKGIGVGRIETDWGLYMFTGCVLASFVITFLSRNTPRG